MAERYLRQSPLAHLGLEGRVHDPRGEVGVTMAERGVSQLVSVDMMAAQDLRATA